MIDAVKALIQRNSMKLVTAPAPSDEELDLILQAAISAPDHGHLTPWRFKIIRAPYVPAFAEFALRIRQNSSTPMPPEKEAGARAWLSEVPLIVACATHIDYANTKISESERMLATGAAMMNILNAAHLLGYGAFWSTGLATGHEEFESGLGFDPLDYRFMGFLAIGTPRMAVPQKNRLPYGHYTKEWTQPE